MKLAISTLVLLLSLHACGQEFIELKKEQIDHQELKQLYDRYVGSEFSSVAHELAKRAGENPVMESYIPQSQLKEPWDRSLALTLASAWSFHMDYAALKEPRGKKFETLMSVLEDKGVGPGRMLALHAISTRLNWESYPASSDKSLPPIENTIRRLLAIASNGNESLPLRQAIVPLLFEYGDPNGCLNLAIELTSREKSPLAIAESFRFATPVRNSTRLTAENRAMYLNHAFHLLESIDDKKSGTGYFLAIHIGNFAGVKSARSGQGAFAPGQTVEEYQREHGPESFFQKTVDNAMEWWMKHRNEYQGEAVPPHDR